MVLEHARTGASALGYDTLAIDLPGHGESVGEKATIDSWRHAVTDVVAEGDVLVGHSMGGYVISLAADEVPEKVNHLIYLGPSTPVEGKAIVECTPMDGWECAVDGSRRSSLEG